MIAAAFLAASFNFAATPERAATNVSFPSGRARVVSTVRVGRYAVVVMRGATIEVSVDRSAILLEHFSFGWQPLLLVDAPCQIVGRNGITKAQALLLARDIPPPSDPPNCTNGAGDRGPQADVEAIRRLATARGFVPFAAVSGDYGFLSWYGPGGGEQFFKRVHGRWHTIMNGGGAVSARDAAMMGVPRSASRVFGLPESFGAPRP
jgi:hypothetical protein